MYNSQIVVARIKKITKEKSISMAFLNEKCELSESTISSSAKSTYGMKAKNLYMIADCLDVSVDYLLGRTDNPDCSANSNSIKTGDINGDNNANMSINSKQFGKEAIELTEMIENLSLVERSKVVLFIDEMKRQAK